MRLNSFYFFLVLAGIFLPGENQARASQYFFKDLGTLGGNYSSAAAINNAGQVVGFSLLADGSSRATLWGESGAVNLGGLGNGSSMALSINDSGQIAGVSQDGNGRATLWNHGVITDLSGVGRPSGYASAINNQGRIVGRLASSDGYSSGPVAWLNSTQGAQLIDNPYNDASVLDMNNLGNAVGYSEYTAIRWNGDAATALRCVNGSYSYCAAHGINDAGVVVGNSSTEEEPFYRLAAVWKDDVATALETLGGHGGYAYAVNNVGQIVGESSIGPEDAYHAALWFDGEVVDLNGLLDAETISAGWVLTSARDINERGWIAGDAINIFTRERHAYLLSTVVPEPQTYLLALAGVVGLLLHRHRRSKTGFGCS